MKPAAEHRLQYCLIPPPIRHVLFVYSLLSVWLLSVFPLSRAPRDAARSAVRSASFRPSPHRYPATPPPVRTTRWHGTTIGTGFVAHARATARAPRGVPNPAATSA